uniref:RNA-binding protein 42 n=1 Tax=Clastoptera arizonana TaxID=38151 RepID=A0A1B6D0Z3_9HEMI
MDEINDEKLKMMEDEMNRFEEEIGLPNLPLPITKTEPHRPVIGANTYNQVQQQLDKQSEIIPDNLPRTLSMPMRVIPPPPPPPPMFIPPQIQRGPGPPMNPSDGPGNMSYGPMQFPPMRFGPQGHSGPPMGPPGSMGGQGPMQMGQGPMGPPMMGGPGPMMPSHFSGQMQPGPMLPPGFIPPPPPEYLGPMPNINTAPGPVVLSATPKLYTGKPYEEPTKLPTVGPEYPPQIMEEMNDKKNIKKFTKTGNAKEMAEKVKTTTVVSISSDPHVPQQSKKKEKKNKKMIRTAGGQTWEDSSLMEWEDDDFRLFCGDLGNDVTDEVLTRAFSKYNSFLKARVVRDKRTNKTKGFGFVSFKDPQDFIRATKEMNGRYVGSRPIKLRKSSWKNRSIDVVRKKEKEKTALISLLTGRN